MKVKLSDREIKRIECEAVISYFFTDERPLQGVTGWVDQQLKGSLTRLLKNGKINGHFKEFILIGSQDKISSPRILLVGLGDSSQFSFKKYSQISEEIRKVILGMKVFSLATPLPGLHLANLEPSRAAEIFLVSMAKSFGDDQACREFNLILIEEPNKIDRILNGTLQAREKLKGKIELEVLRDEDDET
ncbi:MAG: hypothetical protein JSU92_14355 [Deltaproteobacteria bacterium]|nr:MAG: hypothetical protein JSU92_14355 [Deltaproteobacteria bacterium]